MRRDILELDATFARATPERLTLLDVESVRLMLTGGSVIDWQRLSFESVDQVDRFLSLLLIDASDADDRARLRYVFNEAVSYLEEHLLLRFPASLRDPADVREVFLWASQREGFRRTQILSCVILKLMHVIHHMEAADLRFRTSIAEEQIRDLAHARILRQVREMQADGLPIVSLYGSRKSRSSIITKLLAKKDSLAATIFDKVRFRIVVEQREDLAPTLAWLKNHVFAFNYVIPGQSHNNLLDPAGLDAGLDDHERSVVTNRSTVAELDATGKNEFSGSTYRMINFIIDYPVRVPGASTGTLSFELGKVVFVMVEFQLLDEETARLNEHGENAHILYKDRQHDVVARRLKRGRGRK